MQPAWYRGAGSDRIFCRELSTFVYFSPSICSCIGFNMIPCLLLLHHRHHKRQKTSSSVCSPAVIQWSQRGLSVITASHMCFRRRLVYCRNHSSNKIERQFHATTAVNDCTTPERASIPSQAAHVGSCTLFILSHDTQLMGKTRFLVGWCQTRTRYAHTEI